MSSNNNSLAVWGQQDFFKECRLPNFRTAYLRLLQGQETIRSHNWGYITLWSALLAKRPSFAVPFPRVSLVCCPLWQGLGCPSRNHCAACRAGLPDRLRRGAPHASPQSGNSEDSCLRRLPCTRSQVVPARRPPGAPCT